VAWASAPECPLTAHRVVGGKNGGVPNESGDELTTIELLVLWEAGGDNTLQNAYGAVQLYAVFEREEELLEATEDALLKLFDLGLVRFVEASDDIGYTARRFDLPAMSRDELVAVFEEDPDAAAPTGTQIWFDPTAEGEALLETVPSERIPRVSGNVRRPWLE
jgi:hypothetical protein